MTLKKGDRAGAILGHGDGVVMLIGYGTYLGMQYPLEAAGGRAEMLRKGNHKSPAIKLDDGQVVYGCECWWASEDQIRRAISSHPELRVDRVHIERMRSKMAGEA